MNKWAKYRIILYIINYHPLVHPKKITTLSLFFFLFYFTLFSINFNNFINSSHNWPLSKIKKSWYPYNKDGQMTNALYSLNTGAGTALARILDELQLSGLAISQSSYQFNKSISEGQVQIRQIRQKVQDLITRFSSSLDNVSEIVSDLQLWLFIFFLIALVFAAAVSVSMIMIMLKKFGAFLWFVHFGWLLFGFLAIVGFAGCMLLSPINAVVVQSCQVLHGFLNDPVTF